MLRTASPDMTRFFVGSAGFALLGLRITMLLILCILERLAAVVTRLGSRHGARARLPALEPFQQGPGERLAEIGPRWT